jgi:hypothetical protein
MSKQDPNSVYLGLMKQGYTANCHIVGVANPPGCPPTRLGGRAFLAKDRASAAQSAKVCRSWLRFSVDGAPTTFRTFSLLLVESKLFNMAKALYKVQKQISKKRVGKGNALHVNSRDAQRLRAAGAREDKLSKLVTAANRANQSYGRHNDIFRVLFARTDFNQWIE